MSTVPEPSASLVRAVQAENDRLVRALDQLDRRRAALQAELASLDSERRELQGRRRQLARIAGQEIADVPDQAHAAHTHLRGRELRRVAGRLLWQLQRDRDIHYRDWYEHVLTSGYAVGGKDPAASFLTNIRDSPAVTRGSSPGSYRIEPAARDRVAQAIAELQAETADVQHRIATVSAVDDSAAKLDLGNLDELRSHRQHLKSQLRRLEQEAEEISWILGNNAVSTLQAA